MEEKNDDRGAGGSACESPRFVPDYTVREPGERLDVVEGELRGRDGPSARDLSAMADYLLFVNDRGGTAHERTEERPVVTRGRKATLDRRQVSFDAMLEGGEDSVYGRLGGSRSTLLDARRPVDRDDPDPFVRESLAVIDSLAAQLDRATGPVRWSLKAQIMETWRGIYAVKGASQTASRPSPAIDAFARMSIDEEVRVGPDLMPQVDSPLSLMVPQHVSFLLCSYPSLKAECEGRFESDMWYLLLDLEDLAESALREPYPELWDLLVWKVDGLTNAEISALMREVHGVERSAQWLSSTWRSRIPRLIADLAVRRWVVWHWTEEERGKWKRCGRCGRVKLAHPLFFPRNGDGLYSICRECRKVGGAGHGRR